MRAWIGFVLVFVALSTSAVAQSRLTPAQLATLQTAIENDAALNNQPAGPDGASAIAAALNADAAPAFWVWRTRVTKAELTNSTSVDGTTFNWTGTGFITRAQGERDAWRELFTGVDQVVNPSLPQVRQAFLDIFSGATAPAPANRTHLSTVSRRKATRAEQLFATGTGSTASPGLLVVEGALSYQDILAARELP